MTSAYKTTCPFCGGHNFYVTPQNGMSYCFNCTHTEYEQGQAKQEKIRFHAVEDLRNYYTEVTAYYHSCLGSQEHAYLRERGIKDSTIEELKIGFCPASTHALYLSPIGIDSGIVNTTRSPTLADRIVFPYWLDGKVTDIRGRSLTDTEMKYKSPFHSAYYRGADYSFLTKTGPAKTVVVTEGEIKAILPNQEGLSTVGLPGMNSFRKISTSTYLKIVLCFDNQRRTRQHLLASIKRYAEKLSCDVWIATLPLRGKEKQDIDSYIMQYGIDSYKKVIASAVPFRTWLHYAY